LKKAGTTGAWSAALKLPARPDGPASIWVSVRDGAGGDSFAMLSLDYDSTPPTIEIVAPDATGGKASAPGPFILVVRASDARGVASLSYESGKEKGELERLPGYGDAFRAFSFPPKSLSAAVTVRAVDGSGNGSSTTVAVAYDAAADAPTAAFLYPAEGEALPPGDGSGLSTILYAYDDDGLAGVGATVDSVRYDAAGPGPLYSIAVPRLAPGKRIATASATDSGGLSSAKTVTGFAQRGAEPRASIGTVQRGGEKDDPAEGEAFVSGSSLVVDGKTALLATIASPTGLSRLEYSLNGGPWASVQVPKPGPDGLYRARMPLPATAPYGRNSVASRAVDSAGAETLAYASFYRVAPMPGAGAVVSEGAYLLDARITGDDRRAVLAPGQALEALWYGRPVSAVSLEPPKPFAEASFEGRSLRIVATADGGAEPDARPTSLKVETVDGDTFLSSPILLVVDSGPPALALESPVPGSPARGSFVVAGTASDPNGLASLEWSVDGGSTWSPFETPGTAPASAEAGPSAFSGAFSATISPEAADGAVGLLVRAVDASGAASVALSCVAKDEAAPSLFFESPRPVDTVNGTVLVSGYAEDALSVASVEFSADGVGWESLAIAPRGASRAESKRASFSRLVDLGSLPEGGAAMAFRVADAAGNASVVAPLDPSAPAFAVDIEADKPTIQVQIPLADDVMRSDFAVSGMAFDDDGIAELFWRLDGSEWTRVDGSNGFAVPFKLLELSDNEHLFEAYAVDLNGVEGEASSRAFRVSREEPVGRLASPSVDVVNRGVITLRGVASDANGIAAIEVSFDNGATYNAAIGTEEWSYELDTRTVPDGVHSVYARLVDGYGTPGLAAGLLSIDNTPPVVKLDTPDDGWEGAASLSIGGRVSDGMALRGARLVISRLGAPEPETVVEIGSAGVFSRDVDIRELPAGWYNVKAEAYDRAGNAAFDSRNVLVLESRKADYAEITFPAHGERLSGRFSVDGRVVSAEPLGKAAVTLDGRPFAVVDLSKDGWFSLAVGPGDVGDGRLSFRVEAVSASGAAIVSDPRVVEYSEEGPWVDIETLSTGDFVVGRPYLVGSAGWNLPAEPAEGEGTGSAKESAAESRRLAAARRPIRVEISRDNGKTYRDASGAAAFKFRLETQEYPNGALRLVIRATFAGGETAVRKRLVVLDTKAPAIAILKPAENGRYNGTVSIEGTASDGNGLSEVSVALRSGDKASYEVPGFIQGSYVDAHLLGATRFEGGIGLSFFDDKVKLQAAIGQGFDAQPSWDNILGIATADTPAAELSRFGGYIIGAKLLASLAYLPFSYFLGPDWDFFSMSFALGASFTYFSMRDSIADILSPPDDRYMILSGVVGQWEFAKFEFGTTFFKTLSLYVEGGFVFIPSEASTKLEEMIRPNVAFGVRIGLF
ncbi:MAG: hypothetical protein KKA67_03995, partial [Spirochaetes bacterium]|nr:hypothetical protein [Spirochaetota bacterium]